jgi:hypothetical protein
MKGNSRRRLSLAAIRQIIVEEHMKIRSQPGSIAAAQIAIFNRVRDEVGPDFAELLAIYDSMLMSNQPPHMTTINIHNSTVGNVVLDSHVANITASVNAVAQHGVSGAEFASAIKQIVEATTAEKGLSDQQKKDILESFEAISEQAELPAEKRKMAVVRPVLEAIPKLLGSASALVSLWHTVGPHVTGFF